MKFRSAADSVPIVAAEEHYGDWPKANFLDGYTVVAIPARDEAEEITGCLEAIAVQQEHLPDAVVLCLNNCTDDTAQIVRRVARGLNGIHVHVLLVTLPPDLAYAGVARRMAMDRAAELAGIRGIVLTTDADGRVAPDWVTANLAAIANGADAVAGRAVIEPVGARRVPEHLHAIDARECMYAALLDEIRSLVDPDPLDPWPRHDEHSGASIAVRVTAYHQAGGLPPLPIGEDRAFFEALRRIDARIRHAPGVQVTVSARIHGRAQGGMADTMRRRMQQADAYLDDRLEPVLDILHRTRLQTQLRHAWHMGGMAAVATATQQRLGLRLSLPVTDITAALKAPYFGTAWSTLEARSPVLRHRRRVALTDLCVQTAAARRLRTRLRTRPATDPADTEARAAEEQAQALALP